MPDSDPLTKQTIVGSPAAVRPPGTRFTSYTSEPIERLLRHLILLKTGHSGPILVGIFPLVVGWESFGPLYQLSAASLFKSASVDNNF